jgi:hypothetical protein
MSHLLPIYFLAARDFYSSHGRPCPNAQAQPSIQGCVYGRTGTTVYQIHSLWLRDVGRLVIGDEQGISWTAQPLVITPERLLAFVPVLDARLSSLNNKIQKSEDDRTTISHFTHLLEYLKASYAPVFHTARSLNGQGRITFDLL